jgi:hypothetical protein
VLGLPVHSLIHVISQPLRPSSFQDDSCIVLCANNREQWRNYIGPGVLALYFVKLSEAAACTRMYSSH